MHWWTRLFSRSSIYSELSQEIEQHFAEKVEELMAGGASREQAEYAAKREFGNVTLIEEIGREAWRWPTLEGMIADVKFALRRLRKSPGFAITAMLTLAMGIGANVVVFSVLNGLILRPLNVPQPNNLFQIANGRAGWSTQSYRDYIDYRERSQSFTGMVACEFLRAGLAVNKSVIRSWGYAVSGNYFDVLGIHPAIGRFFHATDEHGSGSAPYVVISHELWGQEFNFRRNVVGETINLNKHPFTVIGVAPDGFHGINSLFWPADWIPVANAAQVTGMDDLPYRDHYAFEVFGRLKPGVTPAAATDSLNALARQMSKEDPKDDGLHARVIPPAVIGDNNDIVKRPLLAMMLLAFLILLAACSNLAGIFGARAADRSGELAIRMAIGCSRFAVLRQLLTETALISAAGGFLGCFLATLLLGQLSNLQLFGDVPTRFLVAPDARTYAAALALSIASGLLFGVLPGPQIWRTDVVQTIKSGFTHSESFRRFAFRDVLLGVQIVVCTLLVTASLVSARGIMRGLHMPLAFQPEGVTLAHADLRMAGYSGAAALPVQKKLLEAAAALPNVKEAAVVDGAPFQGGGEWFVYRHGTTDFLPSHMAFAAPTFLISPGYFQTAGTRLLAGRSFTWHDDAKSPRVAIINQTFARKLFGSAPAIGERFDLWATAKYQVVGVVEDGKYESVTEEPEAVMFLPLAQGVGEVMSSDATILVRSQLPSGEIAAALNRVLTSVEPSAPFTIRAWADAVDISMLPARAAAIVLGIMALLAAMLAVTGVFGMASYSVSKRMREQGIRMALGAQAPQVIRAILGRPLALLISGSAVGLAAGLLASGLLAHLVSLATPRDPFVLAGVFFTMTLLGLFATWIPARRALALDPAKLFREP